VIKPEPKLSQRVKVLMRLRRAAPVAKSQNLTVRSRDGDATSLPSGEKATVVTIFE
jgi:hypothetical protein